MSAFPGLGNPVNLPYLPLSGGTLSGNLTLAAAGQIIWASGARITQSSSVVAVRNTGDTDSSYFTARGLNLMAGGSMIWGFGYSAAGAGEMISTAYLGWSSSGVGSAAKDVAIYRQAAGVLGLGSTGATGTADIQLSKSLLTAGTMTVTAPSYGRKAIHRYDWTNAMVVALGANLTGDITIATLPAKTIVTNVYYVITGAATGPATLTGAVGRTSAAYIDYIVASDLKAVANTVYGDASGERGTNLTGYDLPSFTATTDVKMHFVATVANLDQTVGSTGSVYIETMTLP